jgi:hypothetical protein
MKRFRILYKLVAIYLTPRKIGCPQLFLTKSQFLGQEVPYSAQRIRSARRPKGKGTSHVKKTQVNWALPYLIQVKVTKAGLQKHVALACVVLTVLNGGFDLH